MKIIKFSTNNCSLCRKLQSMLDNLQLQADEEIIVGSDGKELDTAILYDVSTCPTLIKLDDNDNELARITGLTPASRLKQFFEVE